ncbi:unnamed protein product [Porites evermanni]|uniref:TIR domain-containing protein n=1 Tax=Porites evermanni TaxID=104178 RepID=A0ABN8MIG1_9CNID|nr:unnamed protein product [Porites evermanni]
MAFGTLLVLLAMLQSSITGRSDHLSKRDIKPQSSAMNDKDSSPVSCNNKTCAPKTNKGKNQTSVNITFSKEEKTPFYVTGYAVPLFPDTSLPVKKLQLVNFRPQGYVDTSSGSVVDVLYTRSTTKKSNDSVLYLSISITVGVLVGLGLVAGLLVYFCRSKTGIGNNPLPQDFRYHAFIIFNSGDQRWMKTKLLPLLEEKHHLSCCIHYRDFAVGKPFRDSMAESVYNSHKVIALFSSNFVKSNYCKYELDVAIGRLLSHRDRCLAVIRIDKVDSDMLPKELKDKSFIDYSNATERRIWKRKLLEFLRLPSGEECHDSDVNQNCKIDSTNDENRERLESASSMESDAHQEHLNADMEEISDLSSTNGNRGRIGFMRLESTISNDTVISVV